METFTDVINNAGPVTWLMLIALVAVIVVALRLVLKLTSALLRIGCLLATLAAAAFVALYLLNWM